MRTLVIGPRGQVGHELMRSLRGDDELVMVDRTKLDLTEPKSIKKAVRSFKPDVIINAAAYTSVDRAETEIDVARAVNATGPARLAAEAARIGAALVHFSTDYVFDGTKKAPYAPTDAPNPVNAYGRTKLEGETAIIASGVAHLILRTSWIFSARRSNFLLTVLQRVTGGEPLRIVDDQRGCPTWARTLADATARIVDVALERDRKRWSFGDHQGVHHLAGGGEATWYDFACAIVEEAGIPSDEALAPIATDDLPLPAPRPRDTRLECTTTEERFGVRMTPWQSAVAQVVSETV